MNSERAISSAPRQGCLRSRKAALRRRSRNEEGKVAPFQRQGGSRKERGTKEGGCDAEWWSADRGEKWEWRKGEGGGTLMDRCSSLRCTLSRLSLSFSLSRFPNPADFHPCEPPSTFRLALPGVEKPRNITHSRWASLFSLFLPFSPSPLLPRSALRSPYLRPSSSRYRGEQGALGSDYLFIVDFLKITSNFAILCIAI